MFPDRSELVIQFAHIAYQFEAQFALRDTGIANFTTWTPESTSERVRSANVFIATSFWRNDFLDNAENLKFIQVCGAGYDQFDTEAIRARGIRMANGRGVNTNAVAEHTMSLILGLTRQIHLCRDAQHSKVWRGMNTNIPTREEELTGKTMLVIGAGQIGARVATLGKAFGMRVLGMRRNVANADPAFDAVHPMSEKLDRVAEADLVVLCCPLTPETRGMIDAAALSAMKPSAYLINVARGGCVVEADLINALNTGEILAAGIDVTDPEPLPDISPLWGMENVLLTPHTAGETRRYEDNVLDIMMENIGRLERGEDELLNQIV
jgi:D-2-hydroxyacid dehydrogenase (NADP+)